MHDAYYLRNQFSQEAKSFNKISIIDKNWNLGYLPLNFTAYFF